MDADAASFTSRVLAMCTGELGFALAGVCRAAPSAHRDAFRDWIGRGDHGEMGYLARHVELRLDPRLLLPGARSIVMVADQYGVRGDDRASAQAGRAEPERPPAGGRIARYAQGDDYHRVMKKRLHALADALRAGAPGAEARAFVDTAPVLEREHAARAGLGWVGKHTLLIHPRLGSYVFLGGVITTLDLAPTPRERRVDDHCGACTRCIDACPTAAITPYRVDATRCISYLTIEHRSPIDAELHAPIGDWLYGCDVCQEVCPHNSPRPDGAPVGEAHPAYEPRRTAFDLLEVLGWTEDDRRRAFTRSAMKRASLDMMQRNAAIAHANLTQSSPPEH